MYVPKRGGRGEKCGLRITAIVIFSKYCNNTAGIKSWLVIITKRPMIMVHNERCQ